MNHSKANFQSLQTTR